MEKYEVKAHKDNGWVIVETDSGREIILFRGKEKAEEACMFLNAVEE